VDGYVVSGLLLFFASLVWFAYLLWHTRRLKVLAHDKEIKRAARIIKVRNAAVILALWAFSSFLLILSSLPRLTAGTSEYIARDRLSNGMLAAGIGLLVVATVLGVMSKNIRFDFRRLVRRYAIRERVRAKLRLKRRPKRATRV
jgi:hypothetical protein